MSALPCSPLSSRSPPAARSPSSTLCLLESCVQDLQHHTLRQHRTSRSKREGRAELYSGRCPPLSSFVPPRPALCVRLGHHACADAHSVPGTLQRAAGCTLRSSS
eukprot:308334-Rhodomonas_salina.2